MVGSMSTVVQDLHGGRLTLPAGDTRRSDIDSNVDCESDLKRNNSVCKKILSRYSWVRVDLQKTHWRCPLLAYGGERKDQVQTRQVSCSRLTCSYANQLALDCTSRLNSWDWVLVQVHLASSVPLWATIRMPTTTAISRKRSFTISADKTVVVVRTLGACALFFLVLATTTRLLWASFGATLGQVRRRSNPFQAFFFTCLKDCR